MAEVALRERVLVFDTTLRDGAQSPGIALTHEQSLDIGHGLARLGVDIIEAGFPASSPQNFAAVEAISREVEGPVIAGLARAQKGEIDTAYSALKDAERPRIHTFISTSDVHLEHQMGETRGAVLGMIRASVSHARSLVEDVQFSPMDATRSDLEFTAEALQIAIDEGATTINIPDTVGYVQPEEFKAQIATLYRLVPALGNIVLSVHCHQDLGQAVANTLAGLQAGARQFEGAINGIGERAGNASLEEVIMALRTRTDYYGLDTGIDTTGLGPLSRKVARYTNYPVPGNKAIVGRNAFMHEAGIHQAGVLNDRSTFEIMDPTSVGMSVQNLALGKQSGRHAVRKVLSDEGVFNADVFGQTFMLFKNTADIIGTISLDQLVALQEEAERRYTSYYRLDEEAFTVQKEGDVFSSSVAVIDYEGRRYQHAASSNSEESRVDGLVSAIFEAAKLATDTDYFLKDFEVGAIGSDQRTIGEAIVTLRLDDGRLVIGKGVSNDVPTAAAWAYLHAISNARPRV